LIERDRKKKKKKKKKEKEKERRKEERKVTPAKTGTVRNVRLRAKWLNATL